MSRIVDNKSIDTAIEDLSIRPRLLDEYIGQDDKAQEDAIQLVCDIFDNMEK